MGTADRGEREEGKGKSGRLSSQKQAEADERMRKAGGKPGSEADERKRKRREAPVERLWERSREGRKETNRKLSTGTGTEGMRDQAGENGEDRRSESGRGALRKPL